MAPPRSAPTSRDGSEMATRWGKDTAVETSGLPPRTRHLLHTLLRRAVPETGLIPDRFQPSLISLEQKTGLRHETLLRELNRAEKAGWLIRHRSKGGRGHRTHYTVAIPETGPRAGSVAARRTGPRHGRFEAAETGPAPRINGSAPAAGTGPHAGPQLRSGSERVSDHVLGEMLAAQLPEIDPGEREMLAAWIDAKHAPRKIRAYLGSLQREHLLGHLSDMRAGSAAPAGLPPWCGECDQRTRMRETPDGQPYRCPDCGAQPGTRAV
jgi:hypothetical protein